MSEESDLNTNIADCPMSLLQSKDRLGTSEGADSLESEKERVEELAKFWPGQHEILNQETGERLTITAGDEPAIH
jgi:hypothetical protein